ncbi:MAG: polysaccharide deacetylase family protein [PVC group bacterium]|nr:polysaccharide deacetylase family protein [PVC group bacterium]
MNRKILPAIIGVISIVIIACFLHSVYSVPVLMYHSINGNSQNSRLSVSPESFEKQMSFLKKHNYEILTLSEYVDMLKQKKKPSKRSVVITFDDGFDNNYTMAYPILKKHNIPAVIFIVVNWVGNSGMMNWSEIKELVDSNLIEIGSHTLAHDELTKMDKEEAFREIQESKQILESKLNKPIKFLCYPCGSFNAGIKEIVEKSDYKGACATHPGAELPLDDAYAIRRIRISRSSDNMFIFWGQISGYYTYFKDRKIQNKDHEKNTCY